MRELRTEMEAVNCKWFGLGWSVEWKDRQTAHDPEELRRASWIFTCKSPRVKENLPAKFEGVVRTTIDYCRLCSHCDSEIEVIEPLEGEDG